MKKLVGILFLVLFTSMFTACYFFTTAEDKYIIAPYSEEEEKARVSYVCYLFQDYDSLLEASPAIINTAFSDWYLNKEKLDQKIIKYKGNITYHYISAAKMEENSNSAVTYYYSLFQGAKETLTSDSSTISISGTYFIISDYSSKTSTVLYKY